MILQSLNQLFERLAGDEDYDLPAQGYTVQNISFRVVLNPDGSLHKIEDARRTVLETLKSGKSKNKQITRQLLVPDLGGRTAGIKAYFLSDKISYLLGYESDPAKKDLAINQFEASKKLHLDAQAKIQCVEYQALCQFFQNWTPNKADELEREIKDFASTGFGVFRVLPTRLDVHDVEIVRSYWSSISGDPKDEVVAQCLVTGEDLPIARLHEPKFGGFGTDKPLIVSFNDPAYRSFGKEQAFNAPVSKKAVFQYCNALNAMLCGAQSKRHRVTIGDVVTVFWTEKKTVTESIFAAFLSGQENTESNEEITLQEDQILRQRLQSFFGILRKGGGSSITELGDDLGSKFYILGLSKVTKSRLAVRFWHVGTIGEMVERLKSHFDALSLTRSFENEAEFPSAIRLLDQTARERKVISPLLSGQLMQSIVQGTPYPMTLYQGVLNRLRANDPVNYYKASILKAVLIRNFNLSIPMSLNTERTEPAYLLGRLFAALEKTQEDALGKVNAGIRERFYSSASATPGSVFPRILRTYQHHLAKLEGGRKISRERLVQSIHEPLNGYPVHLTLEQQGLFAIGYYHQRQDFFKSNKDAESKETLSVES